MAIEVGQRLLRVADLERTRGAFGEARTLPGEVYSSEDVVRLEQRGIFAREWLCVGREADIPKAGDWFLKEIAGDSVIVTRDAEGGDSARVLRWSPDTGLDVVYEAPGSKRAPDGFVVTPLRCGGDRLTLTALTPDGDEQVTAALG